MVISVSFDRFAFTIFQLKIKVVLSANLQKSPIKALTKDIDCYTIYRGTRSREKQPHENRTNVLIDEYLVIILFILHSSSYFASIAHILYAQFIWENSQKIWAIFEINCHLFLFN